MGCRSGWAAHRSRWVWICWLIAAVTAGLTVAGRVTVVSGSPSRPAGVPAVLWWAPVTVTVTGALSNSGSATAAAV
jgi:hypothetical protein